MDLDNIKKTWQETDITPAIDEDKIRRMLDNKSKSAFEKLLKYEKLFLWLSIPCLFFAIIIYYMHIIPGIIYSALLTPAFFWQLYKIRFLKKTNISEMSILEVSKSITTYKKYIFYEIAIGSVWIVAFIASYTYYGLPSVFPRLFNEDGSLLLPLLLITGLVFAAVLMYAVYRNVYHKNIREIQDSIKEIQEFENEEN